MEASTSFASGYVNEVAKTDIDFPVVTARKAA
jgi:hypothetical protein